MSKNNDLDDLTLVASDEARVSIMKTRISETEATKRLHLREMEETKRAKNAKYFSEHGVWNCLIIGTILVSIAGIIKCGGPPGSFDNSSSHSSSGK